MGRNEQRFWDDWTRTSRSALATDPRKSLFNAFVPDLIADWEPALDKDTWDRVEHAAGICRDLNTTQRSGDLPAEWLLERAESIASSTIEDIHPSARRVARAEAQLKLFGETPPDTEMEALRNIGVTQHASELARSGADLTVDSLREMHATLMGDDPVAGQVRQGQVWVGSGALGGPLNARHVAPPAEHVPTLLEDLVAYINRAGGPPLVRAAVAHGQFETIHPFPDGNGRTGRALIQFMLLREGVIKRGTLPVSSALTLERSRYYDVLNAYRVVCEPEDGVRSKAAQPWIEMFAEATVHATVLYERLNSHVDMLMKRWDAQARANRIRPSSAAFKLLKLLPANPVVTAKRAQELLDVNERTSQQAVARLAAAGILEQRSAGRRNRVFESSDLMDAFSDAARGQPAPSPDETTPDDNLDLQPDDTGITPIENKGLFCSADTKRGTLCGHPRPRPDGKCPAGHQR